MKLFEKGKARKELMNLIPVVDANCDRLVEFVKNHFELTEIESNKTDSLDQEQEKFVIVTKKKKHKEFSKLREEFELEYNHALELLELVKPWSILDDGYNKDFYRTCQGNLNEIAEAYEQVINCLSEYNLYYKK